MRIVEDLCCALRVVILALVVLAPAWVPLWVLTHFVIKYW